MSFYVDKTGTIVAQTAGLGSKEDIEANIKKTIASNGVQAGMKDMKMGAMQPVRKPATKLSMAGGL